MLVLTTHSLTAELIVHLHFFCFFHSANKINKIQLDPKFILFYEYYYPVNRQLGDVRCCFKCPAGFLSNQSTPAISQPGDTHCPVKSVFYPNTRLKWFIFNSEFASKAQMDPNPTSYPPATRRQGYD